MRYMLILLALLFANMAQAIDCEKVPDCASLGYSNQNDPNCAENGYMFCPFDNTYKVCVNYDCNKLGFTESDKTSWCAELIECKGNPKMTLCQKPCFATDAQSLTELASSGKCKVVTMRNDITISGQRMITLAKNSTLDGNGHTITGPLISFLLSDGAKLKNLHIHREILSSGLFSGPSTLINVQGKGSFEDLFILDENNNTTGSNYLTCYLADSLTIQGNLRIELGNNTHQLSFQGGSLVFENAKVELINPTVYGDIFSHQKSIIFQNSEIYIKTLRHAFNTTFPELTNSHMIIEAGYRVCWEDAGKECGIKLGEGSTLDTKTSLLAYKDRGTEIIFSGTSNKPATAIIQKQNAENSSAVLNVQNTNAKLNYMGTTYRPKQTGTTNFSEIESSGNWIKE